MPAYVDPEEVLNTIVESVVRRALAYPEHLEPAEHAAIHADAERRGITFSAAHALRRAATRATLAQIAAKRAAADIADAAIAAGHAHDALVYKARDRRVGESLQTSTA